MCEWITFVEKEYAQIVLRRSRLMDQTCFDFGRAAACSKVLECCRFAQRWRNAEGRRSHRRNSHSSRLFDKCIDINITLDDAMHAHFVLRLRMQ